MNTNLGLTRRATVVELRLATITQIRIGHLSNSANDKRLYCDVQVDNAVKINDVPFYGAGVDSTTKKPHGSIMPPAINQMVGLLFVQGSYRDPVAAFPIPHPWFREKEMEDYFDIIEDIQDLGIYHRKGSKFVLKKDGSIISTVALRDVEESGDFKRKSIVTQFADGKVLTENYNSNDQKVSEVIQNNDGKLERRNFDPSNGNVRTEIIQDALGNIQTKNYDTSTAMVKGQSELNGVTGQWNFNNGAMTVDC